MKEGKPRHYHHHMEEATGEPVESYKVVCERCQKVLGDVPDDSLRGLKFVMCGDCFGVGDPTIIEIGEPYPEELDPGVDPELREFNRITARVADALLKQERAWRAVLKAAPTMKEQRRQEWSQAMLGQTSALAEYEKMVAGE